jgi:hypothetical protein
MLSAIFQKATDRKARHVGNFSRDGFSTVQIIIATYPFLSRGYSLIYHISEKLLIFPLYKAYFVKKAGRTLKSSRMSH